MRLFHGLHEPDLKRTERVLAVGAFDGVHRGHQRLLAHVCRTAADYGVESSIMTLEPIPAQVFRSGGSRNVRLTLADERERELTKYCVDSAIVVDFNERFRNLSALEFARDVLVERLGVVALIASKTHTFGRRAEADVRRIAELGMDLGFEVHVLPPILVGGVQINSTQIRKLLGEGDVVGARDRLGRFYDLAGEVVRGYGIGKGIGFPTANLRPAPEKLVPGDGVYACAARVEAPGIGPGPWLPAAVNVGATPTVDASRRTLEAHLLDVEDVDLDGKSVRLVFLRRLRDIRKFSDVQALAAQIDRDVEVVRDEYQRTHDELWD